METFQNIWIFPEKNGQKLNIDSLKLVICWINKIFDTRELLKSKDFLKHLIKIYLHFLQTLVQKTDILWLQFYFPHIFFQFIPRQFPIYQDCFQFFQDNFKFFQDSRCIFAPGSSYRTQMCDRSIPGWSGVVYFKIKDQQGWSKISFLILWPSFR